MAGSTGGEMVVGVQRLELLFVALEEESSR
jgi:hypothetical protein